MNSDWHTGFDPYELLERLVQQVSQLTDAHNRLSEQHVKVCEEVRRCQQQILELKLRQQ